MWGYLLILAFWIERGVAISAELASPEAAPPAPAAGVSNQEKTSAKDQQPELVVRVRRLVRQLDAPQAAQRAQAEEALLALGPDILHLLPEVDPQESPQAAVSLARIREQFQRRLAESVLQPSWVSLPEGTLSYWEVFQRIYQQTGNRLRLRSDVQDLTKRLTFSSKPAKKPFWPLLDQLLDQAGLTVYPYDPGEDLMLIPRAEHEQPRSQGACYVGPLRIAAQRLIAQRDYRSRLGDHLVLVLEAAWEPRVSPVVLRLPHQMVQVQDDQGRQLPPTRPEAQSVVPVKVGQKAAELEVRLALPDRSAKQLEIVRGNLIATLPGAMQRFQFGQLSAARNQSLRRAGASVTVQDIRKEGAVWQVEVLLRYDRPSEAFQSHYHWFYRNRAYLESEDGQKIFSAGVEPFRHTDREIGFRYAFEGGESMDKYRFIYEAPGLLLTEEFPFELQKLSLP